MKRNPIKRDSALGRYCLLVRAVGMFFFVPTFFVMVFVIGFQDALIFPLLGGALVLSTDGVELVDRVEGDES